MRSSVLVLLFIAFVFSGCTPSLRGRDGLAQGLSQQQVSSPTSTLYSCSTQVFLEGYSNSPNAPKVSGTGLTYSISPPLPAGLGIDSSTGIISGTPTVATPLTSYTVTIANSAGSVTSPVNIQTAAGYLVNDLSDAHNVGPGCKTASGTCTLRAAIEEINGNASPNVILAPAGQINLTLGSELLLTQSADIFGDCADMTTIDGQATSRVFHVTAGPTSLSSLILQNGSIAGNGGGVEIDASAGSVTATLSDLIIKNNVASNGAGITSGGGGGNIAKTLITGSTIENNTASIGGGGGILGIGADHMTITNSTIQNNTCHGAGGGVDVGGNDIVNILQSAILNNMAPNDNGGGVYCGNSNGTINLTNVTMSGNSAQEGGAIASGNSGIIAITNSTISGNTATIGGKGGGVDSSDGGISVTIYNSLFANNLSNGVNLNCSSGIITSDGVNISDDSSCAFTFAEDMQNTNPLLGPLQNNGGPTETMALLSGSPAIGQANPVWCPSSDQRGFPGFADGKCDIGAYAFQAIP
jgi:Putative Ig domain